MPSQFFITHVEPVHLQKGKEVAFYVREQDLETGRGKSHVRVEEFPHYFFTDNLHDHEIANHLKRLEEDPELLKLILEGELSLEKMVASSDWSFLRAECSKEKKSLLSSPFRYTPKRDFLGTSSPSKLLRWLFRQ